MRRSGHNRTKGMVVATLFVILIILFSSCHRNNDPFIGRWTVEKVKVDFNEQIATPEMVRQYGELEKGNIIEISQDSMLMLISGSDTVYGHCSLRGTSVFLEGKKFGTIEGGFLETETSTPLGKVKVTYKQ